MSTERTKILEMVAAGTVTVEEGERLLNALSSPEPGGSGRSGRTPGQPRFLRVLVDDDGEKVNVRVPIKLLRAGMKLGALIPGAAGDHVNGELKRHGIDLSNLQPEDLEDVIDSLSDLQIDVDGEEGSNKKVRVFCE